MRNAFYKYLYKYRVIKWLRAWLRTIDDAIFKLSTRLKHGLKGHKYTLVPLSKYLANKTEKNSFMIDDGGLLAIKGPQFIGNYSFSPITKELVQLVAPKLEVTRFNNVVVMGGTNFVFQNDSAIHPDEYKPSRDVCPAELCGIARLENNLSVLSIYKGKEKIIEKAVSLLGSCTGNYAHWLTETLPKVLIVDTLNNFNEYPLLVDEWIHPNFLKSLEILNKNNRKIIRIGRWESVQLESLVEISPPAYVPPEYRFFLEKKKLNIPCSDDFPFSRIGLSMLRREMRKTVGAERAGSEKIFLQRTRESSGNPRHVVNIKEIERIVTGYGYEMVDPAKLSFIDQVVLFSSVKKIVSPLGAALANLIFTNPGCQVVGLSPYYENANYYYFSNLMGALGHDLYYVLGSQKNQSGHPFHKDYEIDLIALESALKFLDAC